MEDHRGKGSSIQVAGSLEGFSAIFLMSPSNYKVLFCHGGGRESVCCGTLNVLGDKTTADYVDAGYWAAKCH